MRCSFTFVDQLTDTTNKVFFVLINTAVMMTSVLGNGIVMFVIITRHRLHQPSYFLIFSLALSDFIIALFGQSIYTTEIALKDYTSCIVDKIIVYLNGVSCSTSIMLLCMISRDRWLHVAKGLRYNEYTNKKQIIVISVACWFISMSIAMLFFFEVSYIALLGGFLFVVLALVCFIAICIMNVKIHFLVKSHFNEIENNRQEDGTVDDTRAKQKQERVKVEQSVNRSIIAVIVIYSISWFSLLILIIYGAIHKLQNIKTTRSYKTAFVWAMTMAYFNGAINPFIYAYRCDNIGRDIRAFVLNMKRKVFPGSNVEPC